MCVKNHETYACGHADEGWITKCDAVLSSSDSELCNPMTVQSWPFAGPCPECLLKGQALRSHPVSLATGLGLRGWELGLGGRVDTGKGKGKEEEEVDLSDLVKSDPEEEGTEKERTKGRWGGVSPRRKKRGDKTPRPQPQRRDETLRSVTHWPQIGDGKGRESKTARQEGRVGGEEELSFQQRSSQGLMNAVLGQEAAENDGWGWTTMLSSLGWDSKRLKGKKGGRG